MNYRKQIKRTKKDINALMRDVLRAVYHFERFKEKYFGITYELYYAMTLIDGSKKKTISDLAGSMGIPLHKATRIVQRLCSKSFVKRTTSARDKRVVYVKLTHEGKKCLTTIEDFCFATVMNNLAHVSADEFTMFVQVASKIPEILALPQLNTHEVKYGK
ncbi:MAG TPA: MarR family winged helix-turn-helix transcriptional regulator [Spirochaetota bacterium]|nr:MarR family winged helix-turn-helix transcriptional regulator [Spirochaetota bacterium]HPP51293.1 MarR family winged helix-turn-helix transcriptional regulator [Spirochaetota bacterium]